MEENVSLDANKQKEFVKSVKGIKKLLAKKDIDKQTEDGAPEDKLEKKKIRKPKGLVYLSHIPHGFYEHQMTQYFKQFGGVTNVRVIRSPKTGNSKGCAFVEFYDPSVAQIVAETMNNYLMGKRLIKAVYIPPEKQRRAFRKNWSNNNNPRVNSLLKLKKEHNSIKSTADDLKMARNIIKTLNKTKTKLKELGIDYDFFQPVDIPEEIELKPNSSVEIDVKIKNEQNDNNDKNKSVKENNNKRNKTQDIQSISVKKTKDAKNIKLKNVKELDEKVKNTNPKKEKKVKDNVTISKPKDVTKKNKNHDEPKREEKEVKDLKTEKNKKVVKGKGIKQTEEIIDVQKGKQQKLKNSGVKPMEDFISIQESDGDSDGSLEFDSDEFERLMNENDSVGSSDDDDDSGDDDEIINEKIEVQSNKKSVKPILKPSVNVKKNKVQDGKPKQQAALKRKQEQSKLFMGCFVL
ncbi:unnamed protein product [Leptidea sinapis]|uniref:RRM domain-containing protein n=1 Tax=Leptidea sinapis TaxID=189913 RepID=A0A5E4Q110_9NEOP|nr:unnamed protein product [Leptidea sinapis]